MKVTLISSRNFFSTPRLGQVQGGLSNRLLDLPTQLLMDRYQIVFDKYDAGNAEKTVDWAQKSDRSARLWPLPGDFTQEQVDILQAVRANPRPDELHDLAMIDSVLLGPQVRDARDWLCGYPRDQGNWTYTPLYREFMYDTASIRGNPFFCPPGIVFHPLGLPRAAPSLGYGQRSYLQLEFDGAWRDNKTQIRNAYLLFKVLNTYPFPNPIPVMPAAWYNDPGIHTFLIGVITEPLSANEESAIRYLQMKITWATIVTLEAVAAVIVDELKSEMEHQLRMDLVNAVAIAIGITILTAGAAAALSAALPSVTLPGGLTVTTATAVEAFGTFVQSYMTEQKQEEVAEELAEMAELFRPDNPAFAAHLDTLSKTLEYLSGLTLTTIQLDEEQQRALDEVLSRRGISVETHGVRDISVQDLSKTSPLVSIGVGTLFAAGVYLLVS